MTGNRPSDPIDDEAISKLVRDTVDGWAMPPVRLDQPGWRERIRRSRSLDGLRAVGARLGQALLAGVVLTVAAALVGVYLTSPRDVATPQGSPGASAPRSDAVAASPLPKLLLEGDAPTPSQVVMKVESNFALVDLARGAIAGTIARGEWGSDLRYNAAGRLVCLCLAGQASVEGSYTRLTVRFEAYDGAGGVASSTIVATVDGAPDPRGYQVDVPAHVVVRVTYSPDNEYAFVGWAARQHPVWKSGIVVIDPISGNVLGRVSLPDRSDGEGDARTGSDAPQVLGRTGDGRFIVGEAWYSYSPATSRNPTYHSGTDVFAADAGGASLADLGPLRGAEDCGYAVAAGPLAGGGAWLACHDDSGATTVRRIDSDGVHDVRVAGLGEFGSEPGSTLAVSRDGGSLFLWDPIDLALSRVDLATGEVSTASGTAAVSSPLAALGRWLTPTAAAKVMLSSGLALSPDGSTLYALGVEAGAAGGPELAGSKGVYVFDTATLAERDHWDAVADYVSIAVSADGRFVYAAGSPAMSQVGYGSGVTPAARQSASVTVYDAANGQVRLIAGQLGNSFLLFPSTIVR